LHLQAATSAIPKAALLLADMLSEEATPPRLVYIFTQLSAGDPQTQSGATEWGLG
jgi:hypothetical protein